MRHFSLFSLIFLLSTRLSFAQEVLRPYQDERRAYMEIGLGLTASEAGAPYKVKPDFLKNTRLSAQVYLAPQFIVSQRVNLGVRLGGVFRPRFSDAASNSMLQAKFTPYALPFFDVYLGGQGYRRTRVVVGIAAGGTYVGALEARRNGTEELTTVRPHNQDIFLTIAPHIGVVLGDVKLQAEYLYTTPLKPAMYSLTLSNTFPMGRRKYY